MKIEDRLERIENMLWKFRLDMAKMVGNEGDYNKIKEAKDRLTLKDWEEWAEIKEATERLALKHWENRMGEDL